MLEGNAAIMATQFIAVGATLAYSLVVTLAILFILDKIPGLGLRVGDRDEDEGLDISSHGERAHVRDGAD